MRKYVSTPSGRLGIITLALLGLLLAVVLLWWRADIGRDNADRDRDERLECISRQLAQPWIGLRESFSAPPGDAAARARALQAIERGIAGLEKLDKHC